MGDCKKFDHLSFHDPPDPWFGNRVIVFIFSHKPENDPSTHIFASADRLTRMPPSTPAQTVGLLFSGVRPEIPPAGQRPPADPGQDVQRRTPRPPGASVRSDGRPRVLEAGHRIAEGSVATSRVALRWTCDSPRTGCARKTTPIYIHVARTRIIEWSRQVISIVACRHSAKLCTLAARAFRSQQRECVVPQCIVGWHWAVRQWCAWVRIQSCFANFKSESNPDPVPTRHNRQSRSGYRKENLIPDPVGSSRSPDQKNPKSSPCTPLLFDNWHVVVIAVTWLVPWMRSCSRAATSWYFWRGGKIIVTCCCTLQPNMILKISGGIARLPPAGCGPTLQFPLRENFTLSQGIFKTF